MPTVGFSNVIRGVYQPVLPVNYLISSLPRADRELVSNACDFTELPFGEPICQPGDAIRHVYFPTDSYISLITPADASESLEIGMVGNEGILGITLLLGVKTSALLGLVQGGGLAFRMTGSRFVKLAGQSDPFRKVLDRYLYVLTAQLAQTAACSRFHLLDARMARWLLMTQDRAHRDTFRLTHQFLAFMLGVRRAGVTEAAGRLQARRLIRYSRGELTVLDRIGLEKVSCACYGALKTTYVSTWATAQKNTRVGSVGPCFPDRPPSFERRQSGAFARRRDGLYSPGFQIRLARRGGGKRSVVRFFHKATSDQSKGNGFRRYRRDEFSAILRSHSSAPPARLVSSSISTP